MIISEDLLVRDRCFIFHRWLQQHSKIHIEWLCKKDKTMTKQNTKEWAPTFHKDTDTYRSTDRKKNVWYEGKT